MAKLVLHEISPNMLAFHCPGCGYGHAVTVNGRPFPTTNATWSWNGSFEAPTFAPSLLIFASESAHRCHSFVREGRIEFLSDCFHSLKGQTVSLPAWGR
jgi:hypothetical protein